MTHEHGDNLPKLTRNQAFVFETLQGAEGPLSAYTILNELRDDGFRAPLQVYRALDKLVELNLVHRLESLNAFVACDHPDGDRHGTIAFAICEDCGRVDEFGDEEINERLGNWATAQKFRLDKTIIELRGSCEACAVK
jgi:Fur family transcriptional regulator, zinc uptake regulator